MSIHFSSGLIACSSLLFLYSLIICVQDCCDVTQEGTQTMHLTQKLHVFSYQVRLGAIPSHNIVHFDTDVTKLYLKLFKMRYFFISQDAITISF